ncbi:MAG: SHOCT domain-containing protein [Kineosporiaceae bacterium]
MTVLAQSSYPLLDVMWTMLVFFCWILWFWCLFTVYGDLFRRRDIGGWGKTGWVLLTLLVPFIGVFIYLIAEGRAMAERSVEQAKLQRAQMDEYVRSVAATSGDGSAQIGKAKELFDSGAITADEYEALKRKVLA